MSYLKCEGRLNFLSKEHKSELNQHFGRPNEQAMPHQLAVRLGLSYSDSLAILSVLEADKLCQLRLLIYHICTETPVGSIPFGQGFPKVPWHCPYCEEIVEDTRELNFDFMATNVDVIEFI
jgi:hypothetical protein